MEGDLLRCPESGVTLQPMSTEDAEAALGARLAAPANDSFTPVGRTPDVMLRADGAGAYPVRDRIPILLAPELLVPEGTARRVDIGAPRYAEAYGEMAHYDAEGARDALDVEHSTAARDLVPLARLAEAERTSFPAPERRWLDAKYELAAQLDAFRHLAPLTGTRVLQLGGRGIHAVRFLLAGARSAVVVSPMLGEMRFAVALARACGVEDRLRAVVGLAEELPLADGIVDRVYAQGSLHHWQIAPALSQCMRVLVPGGRFAAVEPWRGPFYGIGTRVLGKRDRSVHCVVLSAERLDGHLGVFEHSEVIHHGTLTRYPLLALSKLGVKLSRGSVRRIGQLDDRLASRIPGARSRGSSVAILGTRAASVEAETHVEGGT